jgi:cytochrome P450
MEYNLFFLFLIVAGNETTRTMAANGMRTPLTVEAAGDGEAR